MHDPGLVQGEPTIIRNVPVFGEKMFLVILAVVCGRDVICHYHNMNVFF